jgi:hypothetical protein
MGRRKGFAGRGLILYGDLIGAVRRECPLAIRHWWGVGRSTVQRWRKVLAVELSNPGTHRLRSAYTREPWAVRALWKAHRKARDPERLRKIAEAKRGKPRPAHVGEAVRRANMRRKVTAATRARMSAAHRARVERGTFHYPNGKPWREWEDDLVSKLPAAEAAHRTKRTLASVYSRREVLGVPDGRRKSRTNEGT